MCETVLIISDNDSQSHYEEVLRGRLGYQLMQAASKEAAMSKLIADSHVQPDLVLIDINMSETLGLDVLHSIRVCKPQLPIIMIMPDTNDKTISHAYELGVNDIVIKPYRVEQLRLSISNVISMQRMTQYISYLERRHEGGLSFDDLVGASESMQYVRRMAHEAARKDSHVWLDGESGTGRETIAMAIHGTSDRATKPFIMVDCLQLDEDTADNVLFGNDKTDNSRAGKLIQAGAGVIALKNVGVLAPSLQQKLLIAMAGGNIAASGDVTTKPCKAQFIFINTVMPDNQAAFQTQPIESLKSLCEIAITVPPLRERREDIALMANHFVRMYSASENKRIRSISDAAVEHLCDQSWSGNVRELMHLMWRAVLMSTHESIEVGDIRVIQQLQPVHYENRQDSIASRINPLLLDTQGNMKNLEAIEKEVIQFALTYSGGCMTHAAKHLGIGRSTLYRRMSALNLDNNHISRENQMTRPTIRMSSKAHS